MFNLSATRTDTFRCQCTTKVGEHRTYINGGVVSLTRKFGFAVLRMELWQDSPDNVIMSRTRFPGTKSGMEKGKRQVESWARTGRLRK